MLQRLPIAYAQVKAGNTSENLINEMRQFIYSLHRTKEYNTQWIQQHNEYNVYNKYTTT